MDKRRKEKLCRSIIALLAARNEAVVYFTHRDLLGEAVDPVHVMWRLKEPQKIIRKQSPDGSWTGPIKGQPIYPENHAQLIATFKAFRRLVESYQFTRESISVEKAAEYIFSFQTPLGDIRGFIGNLYAAYYTGYILALLIQAGYVDDPRVENGMQWLLKMRQNDKGWSIPILAHHFDGRTMYRLPCFSDITSASFKGLLPADDVHYSILAF